MAELTLTIDGRKLTAHAGQTVLEVALANGIEIPNLCHDPRLTPVGACRLCLVRIEGVPTLQTACSTRVRERMVVCTEDEEIRSLRRSVLELLLCEHGGSCTRCDALGTCQLQRYAYEHQVDETLIGTVAVARPRPRYTDGSEAIAYDPLKCIRCGRCVRICEEVQAREAITFRGRAGEVEVSTAFDLPLGESGCELCGSCIGTCPTGALYERAAQGLGQGKDLVKVRTICPYCGVGCQLDLQVNHRTNRIVRVSSEPGCVPNDGLVCVKGRFGQEFVSHEARLKHPLVRMDGELRESSWEEALAFVVRRLGEIKAAHGPDVLGGFASAKCTNEENYLFQKLMRACLGTNNVDHCARLCHASTVAGLAQAFGSGAMTNSIGEIRHAECILVIGSNTTEAHPVIGLLIKEAVRKNGARLIVADPRRIELAGLAKLHLRQRPGTDVALVNALMHEILRQGLHKQEFIAERTEGFAELAASLQDYSPERMAEVTGVAVEQIRAAARLFAGAPSAAIVYSMGITQHSTGTDNVLALANLAMLTGNLGRPGAGVNPLRGQNNVQGACDMGALPVVYPGYQPVASDAVRQRFEAAWGVKLSEKPGLTMMEMMHGLETGRLKALYIMGENPALSDPNLNRTWEALRRAELLVVQDIFLTETAELAHVVLPSCCFAEKEGTFTNTERRVQRVRQAVRPPGEARDDWRILCDISTALGYPMAYDGPEAILREVAALAPIYGGITYPRIAEIGLQWPCPDVQHPGTPILHRQTFTRGKGRFHAVRFIEPAEQPEEQFPLLLTTGRLLHQFHTGTLSRKSCVIRQASPEGCLEIHPDDAARHGIVHGDRVEIETRRGRTCMKAEVTRRVERGTLFAPFHFAEGPANVLTNDALDPVAKIPEFKVCAARIGKV